MAQDTKAIIGYIDILGYDSIVKTMIQDSEFVKGFDTLMYGVTINLLNKFKSMKPSEFTNEPVDEEYFEKVVNTIRVRFIYDNIIFSLPLSDMAFSSQEFDKKTTVLNCIESFFSLMLMISTFFIAKTGSLLRGGIAMSGKWGSDLTIDI